jgi:hypothetical protein
MQNTEDPARWQRIRANKKNQKTAQRIGLIGESEVSPEHKQVLQDAMKLWADKVNLADHFPDITNLLTSEAVYHLAFCSPNHIARNERTIVCAVALAIVEEKTPEQCARLFKSKTEYYKDIADAIAQSRAQHIFGLPIGRISAHEITHPLAEFTLPEDEILNAEILLTDAEHDDEILSAEIITGVSKKPTRRIRISVKRFEKYGILRGDTAIVIMNGDVRIGELGYFAIPCGLPFKPSHYDHFTFVCEQDSTCTRFIEELEAGGICLRHDDIKECNGHHDGRAYGRVCAIERKRRPVEHSLKLRPFDEREVIGDE